MSKYADHFPKIEGLDAGIARFVEILAGNGIETFESCQGGPGHCFAEPTVRFHGNQAEGFRALSVAHNFGLPVSALRRYWAIIDGEPVGPKWELTFTEFVDGANPWIERRTVTPPDPEMGRDC
jgi:hypothetical protein